MKRLVPITLAAAAVLGVAACASQPEVATGERRGVACFSPNDVAGWKEAGGRRFNIRTTRGEYYTANLMDYCPEVDFSQRIGLATRFFTRICEGGRATLIVPSGVSGTDRCRVENFRRLTDAEVAALTPRDRP